MTKDVPQSTQPANPGFFSVPLQRVDESIVPEFKLPLKPHAVKQNIKTDRPLNPLFDDSNLNKSSEPQPQNPSNHNGPNSPNGQDGPNGPNGPNGSNKGSGPNGPKPKPEL